MLADVILGNSLKAKATEARQKITQQQMNHGSLYNNVPLVITAMKFALSPWQPENRWIWSESNAPIAIF